MKRALLIGGAGFIGHNLALSLKTSGFEVAIVDGLEVNNLISLQDSRSNFSNRNFYIGILEERLRLLRTEQIPIFVEDARDYVRLSRVVSEFQPNVIYLLAAVSHASRANKDPYSTFDHSFRTLENTLDIAKSLNQKPHVIFFSSSMVYGNFMGSIPSEEANCDPRNIYGALKLGGEKLALAYSNVFGFPVTVVRPSALYGPRCISRRVLQIFIENAISGKDLVIQGDGMESLDFTFVDDLISGVKLMTLNERAYGHVFNVTRGEARSINHAADLIRQQFSNIGVQHVERDTLNPERGALDISKATSVLGYVPEFDLEKGLSKYISWYRSNWDSTGGNSAISEKSE